MSCHPSTMQCVVSLWMRLRSVWPVFLSYVSCCSSSAVPPWGGRDVGLCMCTGARIYSGAGKDHRCHMVREFFYCANKNWLALPPDSILLMMPPKPLIIWRCISPHVFLVRASSHSSKSKGKWCYHNTMQCREACVVLLQLSVFKSILSFRSCRWERTRLQSLPPPTAQLLLAWSLDQVN